MNPQDVAALMALLKLLNEMSSWPFGIVFFSMVLGPWICVLIFWRADSRRQQIRDDARQERRAADKKHLQETLAHYRQDVSEIKRLYESNSRLVMATNEAFKRLEKIYGETISVISLCTQTQAKLVDDIEKNQYCPIVRGKGGPAL